MKEINLTITGMRHYYGNGIIHVGDILRCKKEPENEYDAEAIQVLLPVYGKVGYIANSPYTVAKGTLSAGRAYDQVKKKFTSAYCLFVRIRLSVRWKRGRKKNWRAGSADSFRRSMILSFKNVLHMLQWFYEVKGD